MNKGESMQQQDLDKRVKEIENRVHYSFGSDKQLSPEQAIHMLSEILAQVPYHIHALRLRATYHMTVRNYQAAIPDLNIVLSTLEYPDDDIFSRLASCYYKTKQYDLAEQFMHLRITEIETGKDNWQVIHALASFLIERGRFPEAQNQIGELRRIAQKMRAQNPQGNMAEIIEEEASSLEYRIK